MSFKYCPRCGFKLTKKLHEERKQLFCPKCCFLFFQNSKPTVAALITDSQNRILLAKRKINPFKSFWDLPGGFLEFGEEPQKGLKREIREELGITIKILSFFDIAIDNYHDDGFKFATLNIYYLVKIANGKPKPDSDISEIKWFGKEEIPFKKLAFSCNEKILKKWLKK